MFSKIKKLFSSTESSAPVNNLHDYVEQLAAIYDFYNKLDFNRNDRFAMNSMISEIKIKINKELEYFKC